MQKVWAKLPEVFACRLNFARVVTQKNINHLECRLCRSISQGKELFTLFSDDTYNRERVKYFISDTESKISTQIENSYEWFDIQCAKHSVFFEESSQPGSPIQVEQKVTQ